MLKKIQACAYLECSCFAQGGVKAVYDEDILCGIYPRYAGYQRKILIADPIQNDCCIL